MPRVRPAPIALVALWAALMLAGGAAPTGQAFTSGVDVATEATTVHTTTGTVARRAHVGSPTIADAQPLGEADGEELDGRPPTTSPSSFYKVASCKEAVVRGRRASRAQSCALLCVFLC